LLRTNVDGGQNSDTSDTSKHAVTRKHEFCAFMNPDASTCGNQKLSFIANWIDRGPPT